MNPKHLSKQKLFILGTGLFASAIADLAEESELFKVEALVGNQKDDNLSRQIDGRPILHLKEISKHIYTHKVICALGTTHRRGIIQQAQNMGFEFDTLIHSSSRVSNRATISEGAIIGCGSIIDAATTIGRYVIINRGCLIGHHSEIMEFSTISPGANIAGSVSIGVGSYVGMGAIILDHIKIGANCVIGAGSVVTKDLPDCVQVTGIPAKITKTNITGL